MEVAIFIYYRNKDGDFRQFGHRESDARAASQKIANIFKAGYTFVDNGKGTTTYIPVHQIVSIQTIEIETSQEPPH